ncbi:MAG: hypothetical protein M3Z04_01380 [Chloroflexota bacterium]|nr:hypothetical protein [Chloroflexota bacterium]
MIFDWPEFLLLARNITGMGATTISDEAYWRAAVSRAYYAAYHVALAYAERRQYQRPAGKGSHEALIAWYSTSKNPRRVEIGAQLDNLFRARISADYHKHPPRSNYSYPVINQNNLILSLLEADHILQSVGAL